MGNALKTTLLLGLLTGFLLFVGQYFGGQNGMILALVFAGVMNFVSYFFSDKIALAMYRAQPVTREELPRVYQIVERLTQRVGMPDAEDLRHSQRFAQRLRHRAQPQPRFRRGDAGNPEPAER